MEETSGGATEEEDRSARTERHAGDITCTEENNKITVYKLH